MKRKYRITLLLVGVLLLFVFNLQFVVPVLYFFTGIVLYTFFFCWAKAKDLDSNYDGWDYVLNTSRGMLYFIISGSFIWIFVLIPFVMEQREKLNFRTKERSDGFSSWYEYLKNPMKLHKDWFNNFYQ